MTLVRTVLRTAAGARDLQAAEHALTLFLNRGRPSPDLLALQAGLQSASGRREAARNTYLAALRLDPGSLDALSGLISLELEEGGAVRVRPYVARAVEAHSDQADYLVLAARVSAAVGDLAHAERAARSALSHSPAHVPATLLLSDVLMRLGRGDEARQLVEQALAREPASFSLQFALGQILEGFGRLADARATYERLAAPTRQGAQASARLAALHTRQGNLDLALSFASTAKQYLPADPMVSDTLGWVYVQKGVPSLGVPHLEEAVRLEPEQAVFRYHLGLAYRATGRTAKAVEQLKRALALDPRLPGAAEALAALLK